MITPLVALFHSLSQHRIRVTTVAVAGALFLNGCSSGDTEYSSYTGPTGSQIASEKDLTLMSGDVVQITFPGAPDLNITQTIRRDGRIDLPLVEEVDAVGLTPDELEDLLAKLYEPQLVTSEVLVSVVSSSMTIFVTGSVSGGGKIEVNRKVTALEAIMEAGGPVMGRSNLRNVKVIRDEGGIRRNYKVNIKDILDGKPAEPFVLQPFDIVFVPELKF